MAKLAEVNGGLKKGEGWIGYRFSNNTKTNDGEEAYRQLLDARGWDTQVSYEQHVSYPRRIGTRELATQSEAIGEGQPQSIFGKLD